MIYHNADFFVPGSLNTVIWKYFDFPKFLSMLINRSLYFSKITEFKDLNEGDHTGKNLKDLNRSLSALGYSLNAIREYEKSFVEQSRKWKSFCFVSSWHIFKTENYAMWNIYGSRNFGIAIKSTLRNLVDSLAVNEEKQFVSKVKYIDYGRAGFDMKNVLLPFVHKDRSYQYEHELRAIYLPADKARIDKLKRKNGVNLDCNIEELIKSVYVSPFAEKWIAEIVGDILSKFGISKPVFQSSIRLKR